MEIAVKKPLFLILPFLIISFSTAYYFSPKINVSFFSNPVENLKDFYVGFDESMKLNQYKNILNNEQFNYIYNEFKTLYERNSFKNVIPQENIKIPKIIHIMWLGKKLPVEYERFVQSWYDKHPDWTILFWTDNSVNYHYGSDTAESFQELSDLLHNGSKKRIAVETSKLNYANKVFYDRATNYGEKSDILKWEIVYRFGGVYVDIDFEAFKPLDTLHCTYDFYTGIQPLDTNLVQLGAALFAARPNHPIMQACVENIKYNQHIPQIVSKTGPLHFTRCFLTYAGKSDLIDVALPASYLYPCDYEEKGTEKILWCKPESMAVHHWAGSWLKPEAFVKR